MTTPRSEPRVRAATRTDYPSLCMLWRLVDQLHHQVRPDFFRVSAAAPRSTRYLDQALADSHQQIFVAELAGELCGLVEVKLYDTPIHPQMIQARRALVEDLVVDEAVRRRRVGRALMEAAAGWAKAHDASQLVLTVWSGNHAAERFYEALGYQPVSRVLGLSLRHEASETSSG